MTVEQLLWTAYDAPYSVDELVRLRVVDQVWRMIDSAANQRVQAIPYTNGLDVAQFNRRSVATTAAGPSGEIDSSDVA